MLNLAQSNILNSNFAPVQPGGYYAQIYALTATSVTDGQPLPPVIQDTPLLILFSPFLIYGVVIVFFGLFAIGMTIQFIHKTLDIKRGLSTLVVAFIIASLPVTLKTALEMTTLQSRAGPDALPRQVSVKQVSPNAVLLTWETLAPNLGSVRFGKSPLEEAHAMVVIGDLGKPVTTHKVTLENLQNQIEYEVEILSGTMWFDNNGQPIKFRLLP